MTSEIINLMDFLHHIYWNVTYYVSGTGLVHVFMLASFKTKCYHIIIIYTLIKHGLESLTYIVLINLKRTVLNFNTYIAPWLDSPCGPRPYHCWGSEITLRHTTFGRTPLDEWSDRRRDLYLTTHNTHRRQTSMPLAGFETAIPASERPQTKALDRAATGIGSVRIYSYNRKST